MTLIITGSGLRIEDVVNVARHNQQVELHEDAVNRIHACRAMLEKKIEAGEIMYGVNTGIGEFSEVVLTDDQVKEFQKYLIYNHAAGIGDPMSLEYVRGAMLGRVNVHAHGNSGSRLEITQTLVDMLNKGVTPYVCEKGSVGACGDLAPMSQIALLMMGEGKAYYKGELLDGKEALSRAGIAVPGLKARDGLATINGSNVLTDGLYNLGGKDQSCMRSGDLPVPSDQQQQSERWLQVAILPKGASNARFRMPIACVQPRR